MTERNWLAENTTDKIHRGMGYTGNPVLNFVKLLWRLVFQTCAIILLLPIMIIVEFVEEITSWWRTGRVK